MAYATSNPPNLIVGSFGGKPQLWSYDSTHILSEISTAAGFFTDAQDLGMRVGDGIWGNSTAATAFWLKVTAVSSTGATVVAYAT